MNHLIADAVIIGGGAAGSMCSALMAHSDKKIVILEPNRLLGRKLRITGKGRCNVTNDCDLTTVLNNIPGDGRFLYSALTAFPPPKVMEYFESLGVPLKTERGNRVFPQSDDANDIANALANEVNRENVTIIHEKALEIKTNNKAIYEVITDNYEVITDNCVICTGGLSYPKTGSDGSGYSFAKAFGHAVTECVASLVPLESDDTCCHDLQGLSLRNVKLTAFENGIPIFHDQGEMLFTHFGISGPLVLSASAHMRHYETSKYHIEIDMKPALDDVTLEKRILRDFDQYKNRSIHNALKDLLPHKMIPVILKKASVPIGKPVHEITKKERRDLLRLLKHFEISISGARPIEEAIITAGGVDTKEINPRTMESKKVKGLYFAGEILDLDAYTGGFNLQIAWSTAFIAATTIMKR